MRRRRVSPSTVTGRGLGVRPDVAPQRATDVVVPASAEDADASARGDDEASNSRPDGVGRALLLAPATPSRIARFVACAWLLALGGIWAAQQVHEGLHEHVDLPPLVHLVRDASLAVPLAAVAIAVGGWLAVGAVRLLGANESEIPGRVAWAVVVAVLFTILSIPGHEMHAFLFGAEHEEAGWLADAVGDGWVVFQAAIVVLLPIAFLPIGPWPPAGAERPWWARSPETEMATPPEVVAFDA